MGIKNIFSFYYYFKEEELEDGDYWRFTNLNEDELKKIIDEQAEKKELGFSYLGEIISKIQNPVLKERMLENYRKVILYTQNIEYIKNGIFSEEEIKSMIEALLDRVIEKQDSRLQTLNILQSFNISDVEWLIDKYDRIFCSKNKNKEENSRFFLRIDNPEILNKLIERHRDRLPKEYLKFLEVKKDSSYVENKAKHYSDDEIGIDSKIHLGLEVEANNQMGIFFRVNEQKGLEDYKAVTDATVIPRS